MTIPESLGEALLVDGYLIFNHIAQRRSEGRFILSVFGGVPCTKLILVAN